MNFDTCEECGTQIFKNHHLKRFCIACAKKRHTLSKIQSRKFNNPKPTKEFIMRPKDKFVKYGLAAMALLRAYGIVTPPVLKCAELAELNLERDKKYCQLVRAGA